MHFSLRGMSECKQSLMKNGRKQVFRGSLLLFIYVLIMILSIYLSIYLFCTVSTQTHRQIDLDWFKSVMAEWVASCSLSV